MRDKLPDFIEAGLTAVFCGTAAGERSAARGHYYAGAGNDFWLSLQQAEFTPHRLCPEEDPTGVEYGIGLADLAKHIASSRDRGLDAHFDVDGFVIKIGQYKPRWVAFHGKFAARARARTQRQARDPADGGVAVEAQFARLTRRPRRS